MLGILRIIVGLLLLQHGLNKLFDFPYSANHRPFALFTVTPGAAGILEAAVSLLVVFGLFTRPAAFILAGEMAFAYFLGHAPRSFFPLQNGGDSAVLYCFVFLYLFVAGGGAWGLDCLRSAGTSGGGAARRGA